MSVLPEYTRLLPWGVILLTASFCRCDEPASRASGGEDLLVDVFGEKAGKPIASGLLFIDGKYVDGPYRVRRRGTSIYVNDALYRRLAIQWPPTKMEVDEDPGMPEGVTRDSTFEKDGYDSHWHRKLRYLYQHFPPKVAKQKMIEYFRSLPYIKEVRPIDPYICAVEMETHAGDIKRLGFDITSGGTIFKTRTRQDVLDTLERERKALETSLKANLCLFWYTKGLLTTLSTCKAAETLPLIIQILTSEKTEEEKFTALELHRLIDPQNRKVCKGLVKNFYAPQQLRDRLKEFRKKSGRLPPILSEADHDAIVRQVMNSDKPLKEKRNEFAELLREKQRALQKSQ